MVNSQDDKNVNENDLRRRILKAPYSLQTLLAITVITPPRSHAPSYLRRLNGSSPALRSLLPPPPPPTTTTTTRLRQGPERDQHTLRVGAPGWRQGAWDSQPLPPPPRLRLLPAQVYRPRQPGSPLCLFPEKIKPRENPTRKEMLCCFVGVWW